MPGLSADTRRIASRPAAPRTEAELPEKGSCAPSNGSAAGRFCKRACNAWLCKRSAAMISFSGGASGPAMGRVGTARAA
eukprot:3983025-Alexandrium_andersonii.AAC.1